MLVALATLAGTVDAQDAPPPGDSTTTTSTTSTTTPTPSTSTVVTTSTSTPSSTTTTTPSTTDPSTTTTSTVPETSLDEGPMVAAAAADGCAVSRILLPGYQGLDVECLENVLVGLGFLASADSVFDGATTQAVRRVQADAGHYQSGVAGPPVLELLGVWSTPSQRHDMPPGSFGCVGSRLLFSGYVGLDVGCLDNVLVILGYDLAPNNVVDAGTASAVAALQSDLGLRVDGTPGVATLSAIGLWTQPSGEEPLPPPGSYGCAVSRILLPGFAGLDVACVDNVLAEMGYLATPNNVVDAETQAALRAVQRTFGLYESGIGGPGTLSTLSLWQTPATPWPPSAGSFGCATSRTLAPAAAGLDVACLDNILLMLGYRLAPNTTVDASTMAAVRLAQSHLGLPVDGIPGPATLTQLGMYVPPPPPPPTPTYGLPANSGSGRRVVYDRGQQRVWAVDANGEVVKTHRVSGRRYEPYAGTYSVYSRSLNTYSTADPNVKWRYMVRFTYGFNGGRIGFHEIPNRFGVPLQSTAQLGQPLSGGCVRQSTSDALWMWNWAGIGTKVVVL